MSRPDSTSPHPADTAPPPSRGRRLLGPATFALAAGTAVALVLGGTALIRARAEAEPRPPAAAAPLVETVALRPLDGYTRRHRHAARVEPARTAALAFETGGTLVEVVVDEGERVAAGAVVARLDTRLLEAKRERLAAARAALDADDELARLALERQGTLEERGFAASESLDEARLAVPRIAARIAEADAALALVDVELDKSVLRAPFDALVGRRPLDEGATVAAGGVVLALLEDVAPRIRVGLPPARAGGLATDAVHRFVSDGGGRVVEARLVSRRTDIDVRTRTVSALFEPLGPDASSGSPPPALFFGELLSLELEERVARPVFEVPLGALAEDAEGLWSVLLADEEATPANRGADPSVRERANGDTARLRRVPVELVHTDGDRAFVDVPLAAGARAVADGRHRVVPGERVRAVALDVLAERER